MSTPAAYRFLPWTRRGLVAELRDSAGAAAGPLPARAKIKLEVTLTNNLGGGSTTTDIAGPGDVVGIDPSSIVRLTPRRDATNVEPNYLVAIDFDDPDFPWTLTPSGANLVGQLRPWIALIVIADREGVTVAPPTAGPLPTVTIDSGARLELPSLTDSWAWAHTQLLVEQGSGAEAAVAMASDPDGHVSRLLCPRRLQPDTQWIACLVPAFDAGVARGLGRTPSGADLAPAWTDQDSITLPLYFHWRFGTGAKGDFESLARRLQPFVIGDKDGVPTVGTVKMHIGAAGGPVDLPENHPQRIVLMDGALRALQQKDGRLADIPGELRTPLGSLLDAIADPSGTDPDDGAVGPPLYGSWAANRFAVAGTSSGWFAEANLDPRSRVAAGLGADVVRREQEDLMTACWQQVGAVLKANAMLSRARLSIDASATLHAKTFGKLSPEQALTFGSPLSARTPLGQATVKGAITQTSLPDATMDPAMRRIMAPTARFIRKSSARVQLDPQIVSASFMTKLAGGSPNVDPTDFVPSGVIPQAPPTDMGDGRFDLTPIGLAVQLSKEDAAPMLAAFASAGTTVLPPADKRLELRGNLRETGMVTSRHVDAIRTISAATPNQSSVFKSDAILDLKAAAASHLETSGFVAQFDTAATDSNLGTVVFHPIDVTAGGSIVLRTEGAANNEVLARSPNRASAAELIAEPQNLPLGTLRVGTDAVELRAGPVVGEVVISRGGAVLQPRRVAIDPATVIAAAADAGALAAGAVVVGAGVGGVLGGVLGGGVVGGGVVVVGPVDQPPTVIVPPLQRKAEVLSRFESAIGLLPEFAAIADPKPATTLVPFATAVAAEALSARCDPSIAHTGRVGTMVKFGSLTLGELRAGALITGLAVAPAFDRILAYPEVHDPAYRLLAKHDRNRLLPGVDSIPPDSVTLLETNPRFVAAFLAGLNYELNRELLWRRYPTDQRGTPMRRFWDRVGGASDIPPVHQWTPLTRTLANVAGGESNLVLLIRGELLRRYPNTVVVAIKASTPTTPSTAEADVERAIFSGFLEPDITFFGFNLVDEDIRTGNGWFFALQEQITEPRFGFDETVDTTRGALDSWRKAAWPDSPIEAGRPFAAQVVRTMASQTGLSPNPANGAGMAEVLFQNPVQVLVHGRHLAFVEES